MKKILIMGMALLLVGCSQQTQAETNPTIEIETTGVDTSTEIDIGNTTQVTEVLETYSDNTHSGKLSNGDTYTTMNVPTLTTNNHFTEEQSLIFEVIIDMWRAKTDNEKIELQKEGLIGMIKESLPDFTDTEYNEMADYILSQYPIPEVSQTKAETKTETKSQSPSETKASSNTNNSSNTTEPAPQPTEPAPQPTEPVYQETEMSPEEAEMERLLEENSKNVESNYTSDAGPDAAGYDGSGDINLGGGM